MKLSAKIYVAGHNGMVGSAMVSAGVAFITAILVKFYI